VATTFAPPGTAPAQPALPNPTLLERLFPGVPASWVVVRLLSLFVGALLLVPTISGGRRLATANPAAKEASPPSPLALRLALAAALLHPLLGLWATQFQRPMQYLYFAWLVVPALILRFSRSGERPPTATPRTARAICLGIVLLWIAACVPNSWQSPLGTNLLDMWVGLRDLIAALDPGYNLLTGRFKAGGGSLHLMFEGILLFDLSGALPSLASHQALQYLWYSVGGFLLGCLVARVISVPAGAVACAAYLFSPFALVHLLPPLMMALGGLFTILALIPLVRLRESYSPAALAGLGAATGLLCTFPASLLAGLTIFGVGLWSIRRTIREQLPQVLIALSSFTAATMTAVPDLSNLRNLVASHSHGHAQWVVHEMAGFGQISALRSSFATDAGARVWYDVPLSAILAPFMTPRTPLRMIGDVVFDPLGIVLALLGIVSIFVIHRQWWFARLVLGLLVLTSLPVMTSASDRISVTRFAFAPGFWAIVAALGWDSIRHGPEKRLGTATPTAIALAAIAVGGWFVVQAVNPRLLAASWTALALEAIDENRPAGGVVMLDHPDPVAFPYWYLPEIVAVPRWHGLTHREFDSSRDGWFTGSDGQPAAMLVWNPALEEDWRVGEHICARWPAAAIHVIHDRASSSRVFIATVDGQPWSPSLPHHRWSTRGCDERLETEATWAQGILAEARQLEVQGRPEEAVAVLRAAAARTFAAVDLFTMTATLLSRSDQSAKLRHEAVHWAQRAALITLREDPRVLALLAATLAADRRKDEAIDTITLAHRVAVTQGHSSLATKLKDRLREYQEASP